MFIMFCVHLFYHAAVEVEAGETESTDQKDDSMGGRSSTPPIPTLSANSDNSTPDATPSTSDQPVPIKRKRGRPRKIKPAVDSKEPVLDEGECSYPKYWSRIQDCGAVFRTC